MKPVHGAPTLIAIEASKRALIAASRSGEGRVHSVFRRCFNVIQPPSDWLTVALAPFPRVPDGIIVAATGPLDFAGVGLVPGATVRISAELISILDARLMIRLPPIRVFDTRRKPFALPQGGFARNLATAWKVLEARGCSEGLGWARALLRGPDDMALHSARECPVELCRRAVPAIVARRAAIRSNEAVAMRREVEKLLGFGIGLTPSGDDVLGGIAAGLFLGGVTEAQNEYCSVLSEVLREDGRTTEISMQALRHIVAGEIADIIDDVARAIAAREEPAVVGSVTTLLSYGSSSGTEITLGLCTGLQLAEEVGSPRRISGGL